jgi:uncharacterized OB-fold protein
VSEVVGEFRHAIENPYEYPAGFALSVFLEGLRQGTLKGSRCTSCSRSYVPPFAFCPHCVDSKVEYVEVPGEGKVVTWTRTTDGTVLVFVAFDGFEGGILHRYVGGGDPSEGMRVRPKFRSDRIGSILDIEGFEPSR